ncbi:MAG: right-handed parallel beta-helix repeat-containing protein [Victivallales bacterium]|nr:right-handed parallel beta-helix repeat-containing protein [Victivallales bacterium]
MKRTILKNTFFAVLLGCAVHATQVITPNTAKLDDIRNHRIAEATLSWWGYDDDDSTEILEAALASGVRKLVVDKQKGPWITSRTLCPQSNMQIIFEDGAVLEAKRGHFHKKVEHLMNLSLKDSISIIGLGKQGGTFKMQKADYTSDNYEWSTHRHCLAIHSSTNIRVENMTFRDSGGDGIYLGVSRQGHICQNITIKNVICDNNYRQGMSVIAAIDTLVENTKFINTGDTPPSAGVDFEPNRDNEPIRNFVMRNCLAENNVGCGYTMHLVGMNETTGAVGITLENCISRKNQSCTLAITMRNIIGKTFPGHLTFKGCQFEDCLDGIHLNGSSEVGPAITFENCTIRNVAQRTTTIRGVTKLTTPPISIKMMPTDDGTSGNIHFKNTTLHDNADRPAMTFLQGNLGIGGLANISGELRVIRNGVTTSLPFTNEWATETYPKRPPEKFRTIPPFDMKGWTFVPAMVKSSLPKPFNSYLMRNGGELVFYGVAGQSFSITASCKGYGRLKRGSFTGKVTSPSGKKLPADISLKEFGTQTFTIENLPETGLYKLTVVQGAGSFSFSQCSCPIAFSAQREPLHFISGGGSAYFLVPEGTREFAVRFWGEGGEGLSATIYNPAGKQVWQNKDILMPFEAAFHGEDALPGVYRIIIEPSPNIHFFEDHNVSFHGIPPFLSPAPELLLKPVRK